MTTLDGLTREALADAQAQMGRVDAKASILVGLSLAALTGGAAIASKAHLHGVAAVSAAFAAALIGAALLLLGSAIRPMLNGNHGFVRWASAHDPSTLLTDLRQIRDTYTDDAVKADVSQLLLLSRAVQRKYRKVQRAVDLLGVALLFIAVAAIFSGLGW